MIAVGGMAVLVLVIAVALGTSNNDAESVDMELEKTEDTDVTGDVIMPTKVSRPGCEETEGCYVPTRITVERGVDVTWVNEDSAFHSVTSGFYDAPTDLFDSGYMNPYDSYTVTFEQAGTFDYFCTLHPWMVGQVVVE